MARKVMVEAWTVRIGERLVRNGKAERVICSRASLRSDLDYSLTLASGEEVTVPRYSKVQIAAEG
jgi:hypothetical protein